MLAQLAVHKKDSNIEDVEKIVRKVLTKKRIVSKENPTDLIERYTLAIDTDKSFYRIQTLAWELRKKADFIELNNLNLFPAEAFNLIKKIPRSNTTAIKAKKQWLEFWVGTKLFGYYRSFRQYAHVLGCDAWDSCPQTHGACSENLGLDTALSWEISIALYDLGHGIDGEKIVRLYNKAIFTKKVLFYHEDKFKELVKLVRRFISFLENFFDNITEYYHGYGYDDIHNVKTANEGLKKFNLLGKWAWNFQRHNSY